ncbi:MAG: sulfatase-like hydrolase/transferase, partial [Pseudonocardiaceae bacterium]
MSNPFVFIVGCPRSGTTLLRRMVDAHPEVAIIPEIGWLSERYQQRRALTPDGRITRALVLELISKGSLGRYTRLPVGREELQPFLDTDGAIPYSAFVSFLFDRYGDLHGKALVGNKTVDHVRSILTLHELWPHAKFVHLIRDGRDVAASAMSWRRAAKLAERFSGWSQDPVTGAALWWEWHVRLGREAGSRLEETLYHEIRYEALVTRPAGECARLCDFLGVAYDDAMVRFHEGRQRDGRAADAKHRWMPVTQGLRDWRSQAGHEGVERFEAVAGGLLDELGYDRGVGEIGDERRAHADRLRAEFEGRPLPDRWPQMIEEGAREVAENDPRGVSRVVFVLVDALRADHVGWYAQRDVGTPTFDRLASQGVVFANAVAQFPSTRGSVSSIFTGLYPSQHGLVDRVGEVKRGTLSVAGLDGGAPTLAEFLAGAGHVTAAFVGGNANLKPIFGLTRGFLHVEYLPTTDGSVLVDRFERFVRAGLPERAFCYLHLMDVHNPLPDQVIPSRLDDGLDLSTVEERMEQLLEYYAASVRLVDRHIARVVQALGAAGVLDDTLLIVTADHGEEHLEHGAMLAHGRSLYRELVHVPLIVRLPGGAFAGTVVDRPVQLIDLMPTILETAGCPRPDLAGRLLLPAIRGEDGNAAPPAFSELPRKDRYCQSATTSTHQLIVSYLWEEITAVSLADLKPGVMVNCKGQLIQGGSLLPTKFSLIPEKPPRIRGPVDAVDAETRSLTVLGVSFRTDDTTSWLGW